MAAAEAVSAFPCRAILDHGRKQYILRQWKIQLLSVVNAEGTRHTCAGTGVAGALLA